MGIFNILRSSKASDSHSIYEDPIHSFDDGLTMTVDHITLSRYQILEQLYESSRTLVYRAHNQVTQTDVVLKILKTPYPTAQELAEFRHEYEIACEIDIPGVVQPTALLPYNNGLAIEMPDFGGISLSDFATQSSESDKPHSPMAVKVFLDIALQLAKSLDSLSQYHIIHKDIKPQNIVVHPQTLETKLIDFSLASLLPRESTALLSPKLLEGTLLYLSPEQTGRMNRKVDYRTDFYSLGITFYELLTGQLPFQAQDPMELVHCHIAQVPVAPIIINPHIPEVLNQIVLKLIAKMAEDRYQTAYGLHSDLAYCRHLLQEQGLVSSFAIGQEDQPTDFVIPEKLYGRTQEVEILLNTFERVVQGTTELMLVSGHSGVGKTAVISEIHKPIVRRRGYFIQGKFDQLQQSMPFAALLQAFQDLCQQLLMESPESVKQWQTKILTAVGDNGQVIIDVIPEVELLIGPQPPVAELEPGPTLNRFNLVFQQFFQIFPGVDHPLVLFLDDLQWIDSASLKFLQSLLEESERGYLLLIGTYRDNEVLEAHPLMQTLRRLEQSELTLNRLHLRALQAKDLNELVSDTLACSPEQTCTLTQYLFQKTQGNPFFSRQFLQTLEKERLIRFNKNLRSWEWDITEIQALALTGDVVEFMRRQLLKLSPETQDSLKLAACIGNRFTLKTLAIVSDTSEEKTAEILWEALQAGLLEGIKNVNLTEQIQTAVAETPSPAMESRTSGLAPSISTYTFLHDRIQQAAYSLIPSGQKRATHLMIGQQLLKLVPEMERDEQIFELVNQLNRGASLLSTSAEQVHLAELNRVAAQKARTSTAYDLAAEYASMGLTLLGKDGWQQHYDLTLALSELAAEAAYLHSAIGTMESLVESILTHASHPLDQVRAYEIQIQAYTSHNRLLDALSTARKALARFDIHFPESPQPEDIQAAFQDLAQETALFKVSEFGNLPVMVDQQQLAVMGIAASMIPAAYIAAPALFPLVTVLGVKTSIRHGNSPLGAFFYATYSILLTGVLQNIDLATEYSHLALQVMEKFDAKPIQPSVLYSLGAFVVHDSVHLQNAIALLREGYQIALDTGNLEFVGYCAKDICQYSYFCGQDLASLTTDIQAYVKILDKFQIATTSSFTRLFWQVVLNLRGQNQTPTQLVGKAYNETDILPQMVSASNVAGLHFYSVHKLVLGYLFHDREHLQELADQARSYLDGGPGYFTGSIYHFYDSLALLALVPTGSIISEPWQERIEQNQAYLRRRAQYGPMNVQHKYHLVEAERHRVLGAHLEAIDAYDLAIALATEHNFTQEVALAQELAARFYLQWGKTTIAQTYMVNAYYAYERWGATAKLADLESHYAQLLAPFLNSGLRIQALESFSLARTQPTHSSHQGGFKGLDWAAVMKACQALSEEIEIERLLATIMQVVIENAGAERGCLLLYQDQQLCLVTQYPEQATQLPISLTHVEIKGYLPLSLIHYSERTRETLVIQDGRTETKFAGDPYQIDRAPLSQLCMPILRQGDLVGLLYLENNLTPGAFTPNHLEVLHLLTAQAAISIDNAQLYASVEKKVTQRTQQLRTAQLEAEQANQAKSDFLASMSHELRTPLNAILGFSQLMAQDVRLPEHLEESLAIINRSGEHLLDLINDVLALSKIEAGKTTLQLDTFNFHEFLQAIHGMLQLKAKAKGLEFKLEQSLDVPEVIQADERKLRQILINLLGNAIKFTEQGWVALRVTTTPSTSDTLAPPDISVLQFAVEDTGAGIAEDELDSVFEAFVQTQTGLKSQQGTGLGLPISQSFVHLMGGQLRVRSEEGAGTCFFFDLPVLITTAQVTPKQSQQKIVRLAENQPTYRILVVEDQEDNRRLLVEHLSPLGFVITAVHDGPAAIECWQSWHPHLIWMDIQLPGMTGLAAAKKIKQLAAVENSPSPVIVALTANAFDDVRTQALAHGCDGFVSKPYILTELLDLMADKLNLQWIYEESTSSQTSPIPIRTLDPEHLTLLPSTWREQLNQAALFLDEDKVVGLISQIEPNHQDIAASLYQLVKDYQFERLIHLTESP